MEGVSVLGIIQCGDVEINGQCFSLNMKEVGVECKNGVATIRFQTLGCTGVAMEENMANVTQIDNVTSIACSDCPGMTWALSTDSKIGCQPPHLYTQNM